MICEMSDILSNISCVVYTALFLFLLIMLHSVWANNLTNVYILLQPKLSANVVNNFRITDTQIVLPTTTITAVERLI